MTENTIAKSILATSFKIHTELGPGLLESAYEFALGYELKKLGFTIEVQKVIPMKYGGAILDAGFRSDIIVEKKVLIEIKSVEILAPVHYKQVLTYLRLSGIKLGLLINFNESLLKTGIRRVVNNL